MAFSVSNILNNLYSKNSNNSSNVSMDKSKGGILMYGGGVINPILAFKSWKLNDSNYRDLTSKLTNVKTNFTDTIKTSQYRSFRTVNKTLETINPISQSSYQQFTSMESPDSATTYENIFSPSANLLVNMNNYRFKYNNKIITFYANVKGDDGSIKKYVTALEGTPSLFNPLYVVQTKGILPHTPLLNSNTYKSESHDVDVNISDCSIRELVRLSHINNSILGLATYRYSDFMYCRDVGKISNNHLITLRRFPIPIGDNIFEYYDESPGDIGRLITWFDNDENKLEDIMKYEYEATWKELKAERQDVESREEDQARGPLGILLNSTNPAITKDMKEGTAGANHIFSKLGLQTVPLDINERKELLRMYDHNKVYTPPNTIQDTHIYEGQLKFSHEFTLTFNYVLRGYDNINPRSAMLDLIGNILNVTYKRGVFWGGERRIIGPRTNPAWTKATAMIDGAWEKAGSVFTALGNKEGFNMNSIFGMLGSLCSKLFNASIDFVTNFASTDANGNNNLSGDKSITQKIAAVANNINEKLGISDAALGILKNTLGRPAVYAMDSLLTGDDVGLWHVTIGNPKNPIMAMGNLILTKASIQHYGPLGIDDFPTNLKLTVTLKHARSRDSVDIGRMYTSGTNGIYYPVHNKNITSIFPNYMNSKVNIGDLVTTENTVNAETNEITQVQKILDTGYIDMKHDNRISELDSIKDKYSNSNENNLENINTPYAAQIDHTNQKLLYDLAIVLDEIA